ARVGAAAVRALRRERLERSVGRGLDVRLRWRAGQLAICAKQRAALAADLDGESPHAASGSTSVIGVGDGFTPGAAAGVAASRRSAPLASGGASWPIVRRSSPGERMPAMTCSVLKTGFCPVLISHTGIGAPGQL